jgi:hypothetical protein
MKLLLACWLVALAFVACKDLATGPDDPLPNCRTIHVDSVVTATGDTIGLHIEICDVETRYLNPRIP